MASAENPSTMLDVGETAPAFELPGTEGDAIRDYALTDELGDGPVLLSFYPLDFAPACTTEVCGLRDTEWFQFVDDLSVLAISTDGPFAHREFAGQYDLDFPLLSDTAARVIRDYDVLIEEFEGVRNIAKRSTFLVDSSGTIRFRDVTDDPWEEPDLDPVLEAVEEFA